MRYRAPASDASDSETAKEQKCVYDPSLRPVTGVWFLVCTHTNIPSLSLHHAHKSNKQKKIIAKRNEYGSSHIYFCNYTDLLEPSYFTKNDRQTKDATNMECVGVDAKMIEYLAWIFYDWIFCAAKCWSVRINHLKKKVLPRKIWDIYESFKKENLFFFSHFDSRLKSTRFRPNIYDASDVFMIHAFKMQVKIVSIAATIKHPN